AIAAALPALSCVENCARESGIIIPAGADHENENCSEPGLRRLRCGFFASNAYRGHQRSHHYKASVPDHPAAQIVARCKAGAAFAATAVALPESDSSCAANVAHSDSYQYVNVVRRRHPAVWRALSSGFY